MAKNAWIPIALILLGIYLIASGTINLGGLLGGGTGGTTSCPTGYVLSNGVCIQQSVAKCPSDQKTTITLNTKDALATSATDANVSYYVFKSDGKFYKEGTTASGQASFDVQCGNSYQLIAYDDDGTSPDYYPIDTTFTANADEGSVKSINVDFNREGSATISKARDPVDLDSNISNSAGSTVDFDLVIKTNQSNAAFNDITIVADYNSTAIITFDMPGLTKVTCPSRLTTVAARKKECFLKSGILLSKDGVVDGSNGFKGVIKLSASISLATDDYITFSLIDRSMYRDAGYITVGKTAFKTDYENQNDDTDIGFPDSEGVQLDFGG